MKLRAEERQFVKNLATQYKLVPLMERELEKGDFIWEFNYEPKGTDDAWHPSGDCTPSLHALYLKATGQFNDNLSGLTKTFMVGHFWHQYLQELLQRMELAAPENIERVGMRGWGPKDTMRHMVKVNKSSFHPISWRPYHWVRGSGDIAPCEIPGHGDYLVDFKTMKSLDFRKQGAPEWTADKWECQMNIYLDFFSLEKALIVGINKDSPHDMKEFEFHRNQDLIDALYRKWELVSMCLAEGIAPPEDEEYPLPLKGPIT